METLAAAAAPPADFAPQQLISSTSSQPNASITSTNSSSGTLNMPPKKPATITSRVRKGLPQLAPIKTQFQTSSSTTSTNEKHSGLTSISNRAFVPEIQSAPLPHGAGSSFAYPIVSKMNTTSNSYSSASTTTTATSNNPIQRLANLASLMVFVIWHDIPLFKLIHDWSQQGSRYTAFRMRCERVLTCTRLSPSVVIVALRYLQIVKLNWVTECLSKMASSNNTSSSSASSFQSNPHLPNETVVWACCLLLAHKWVDDKHYANSAFAQVHSLKAVDLNRAERECLRLLNYRVAIMEEEYYTWRQDLQDMVQGCIKAAANNAAAMSSASSTAFNSCTPPPPISPSIPAPVFSKFTSSPVSTTKTSLYNSTSSATTTPPQKAAHHQHQVTSYISPVSRASSSTATATASSSFSPATAINGGTFKLAYISPISPSVVNMPPNSYTPPVSAGTARSSSSGPLRPHKLRLMRAWEHSDTLTAAGGGSCSGGSFYGVVGGSQGAVQLRRAAFHNHGPRSASSLHSMTTSFQTATITSVEDAMPAYTKHR